MNEFKKCPKCGSQVENDLHLGSYTEITLKKEEEFVGDRIKVFCCKNCGYIELYREKEKRALD